MNGTAQAGMAVLALVYVAAVFLLRWAVSPAPTPGRHRRRRTEVLSEELRDDSSAPAWSPSTAARSSRRGAGARRAAATNPPFCTDGWTCGHCFEPTIHTTTGDHR